MIYRVIMGVIVRIFRDMNLFSCDHKLVKLVVNMNK